VVGVKMVGVKVVGAMVTVEAGWEEAAEKEVVAGMYLSKRRATAAVTVVEAATAKAVGAV
jgi:hypothetical protein